MTPRQSGAVWGSRPFTSVSLTGCLSMQTYVTSITLLLLFNPLMMWTLSSATPKCFASNLTTALLALPSTGASLTLTVRQ